MKVVSKRPISSSSWSASCRVFQASTIRTGIQPMHQSYSWSSLLMLCLQSWKTYGNDIHPTMKPPQRYVMSFRTDRLQIGIEPISRLETLYRSRNEKSFLQIYSCLQSQSLQVNLRAAFVTQRPRVWMEKQTSSCGCYDELTVKLSRAGRAPRCR